MQTQHSRCCYCRRKFNDAVKKLNKTKDHFVPISRGGSNGENILQCCYECNQWKADREPAIWLKQVEYFEDKRSLFGTYTLFDYRQIIGSIKHWIKHFKGKKIGKYKF